MKRFLVQFIVCGLLGWSTLAYADFFVKKNENPYQADLITLQKQIKNLQRNVTEDEKQLIAWQQELKKLDSVIEKAASELHGLQTEIATQQKKLADLQIKQQKYHQRVLHQRDQLAAQLRTAYYLGPGSGVKLLLGEHAPQEISRLLTYYDYIHRARLNVINDLKKTLVELARVEQSIAAETQRLTQAQKQKRFAEKKLKTKRQSRAILISSAQQQLIEEYAQLTQLQYDEKRLTELLKAFSAQTHNATVSGKLNEKKGQLPWPLRGKLTQHFGDKLGRNLQWKGMLILAGEGEPVRAIAAGRVVYAGWLRGYGLLMIVDHGKGYLTLYGRNQSLYKQVGDQVFEGEMLAEVGQSGGFEKSGLYFELRRNGQAIDPEKWLR